MIDLEQLTIQMGDLEDEKVLETIREIAENEPQLSRAAMDALSAGMDIVGQRFDSFDYFVGDLIIAGEIFTDAMELLKPVFLESSDHKVGKKVVIATVEGDYHDIGKNIVKSVLLSKGLEVIDLGVDVSPAKIVETAITEGAEIIALSAILSFSIQAMRKTVELCEEEGIRDRVRIVIGGSSTSQLVAQKIHADRFCETPEETARFCLQG